MDEKAQITSRYRSVFSVRVSLSLPKALTVETILSVLALVASVISLTLSAYTLLNRQDSKGTVDEIASAVRILKLDVDDVVDRLSVWQRRDAGRKRQAVDGGAGAEPGGVHQSGDLFGGAGVDRKSQLRVIARQRGVMR